LFLNHFKETLFRHFLFPAAGTGLRTLESRIMSRMLYHRATEA
jgi:hypothetical protein